MAVKFNPFTGQLQIDEKGASASYIDGEVATYNDLPLDGTAALNSAWLVRGSSGIWPFTKPGGVYVRTATGGTSRDADYTYAGIFPDVFSDAQFTIYDDSDTSKNAKFQLSGISTGTTRTLTVPDGSGTIQLALVRSSSSMSSNVSLSAGRARHITYTLLGGSYQVTLPLTGNQSGDVCRFTNGTSSSSGAILTVARGNGSGGTVAITTLAVGQTATLFNSDGTQTGWTLDGVDTHAHAASEITSGVLDNARVNFAAPSAIGSTTPSTGAFTTLNANNGTITASAPVLDLSQTWNNAAVTFTGLRMNVTNTASNSASNLLDIQVGGTTRMMLKRDGVLHLGSFTNSGLYSPAPAWHGSNAGLVGNVISVGTLLDTLLERDAAHVIGQRNGTNAQTANLYGTFTSSTNYQRMTVKSVRQTLSALSGASATTTGTFIPDGAVVVGVTTRVTTLLTGATGYTIGDGTDADRWGDITGTAIGTISDNRDWTAGTIECFTAGGNVTLTAKTANFTAGAIEVCVFYLAGEAD